MRWATGSLVLAAALFAVIGGAAAFDDKAYPDLSGQWRRLPTPGVAQDLLRPSLSLGLRVIVEQHHIRRRSRPNSNVVGHGKPGIRCRANDANTSSGFGRLLTAVCRRVVDHDDLVFNRRRMEEERVETVGQVRARVVADDDDRKVH